MARARLRLGRIGSSFLAQCDAHYQVLHRVGGAVGGGGQEGQRQLRQRRHGPTRCEAPTASRRVEYKKYRPAGFVSDTLGPVPQIFPPHTGTCTVWAGRARAISQQTRCARCGRTAPPPTAPRTPPAARQAERPWCQSYTDRRCIDRSFGRTCAKIEVSHLRGF
eukprot:6187965-Pleurochrysis_carterae.AAC.5